MSTLHAVELSADGKRNAFNHSCERVGHTKSFAVCLHLINKMKTTGALNVGYEDCEKAINGSGCPAKKMRAEELEKGQAIYFKERVFSEHTIMEPGSYVPQKVSNYKKPAKASTPVVPAKPQTAEDLFLGGGSGYSEAINESIITKAPEVKVEATKSNVDYVAGESLMQMAQRIMKNKANEGVSA